MIKSYLLFAIWLLIICYLSFVPLTNWPKSNLFDKLYFDKVVHIGMYAILSLLLLRGIHKQQINQAPRLGSMIIAIAFCIIVGCGIEALQPVLTRFRKFELLDMVANTIGSVSGYYFYKYLTGKSWLF